MNNVIIDTRKRRNLSSVKVLSPDIHQVVEYLEQCGFLNSPNVGILYNHLWNTDAISTATFDVTVSTGIVIERYCRNGYIIKVNQGKVGDTGVRPTDTFNMVINESHQLKLSISKHKLRNGYNSCLTIPIRNTMGINILNTTLFFNIE